MPNLSRTVCIEKLTESVSITGFSVSGMVGVSWHIFELAHLCSTENIF